MRCLGLCFKCRVDLEHLSIYRVKHLNQVFEMTKHVLLFIYLLTLIMIQKSTVRPTHVGCRAGDSQRPKTPALIYAHALLIHIHTARTVIAESGPAVKLDRSPFQGSFQALVVLVIFIVCISLDTWFAIKWRKQKHQRCFMRN